MERIFGPVPSRRLGRSLGIDVIPYKTCTFNCVYCECGPTTTQICERRDFFPLHDILEELDRRLSEIPHKPDVLTLSGAGEPTLYIRMGDLIREAKRMSDIPVAVITNSSLLSRPDVREELRQVDIVLPSLDAAIEDTFKRMNRPHECCDLGNIIEGIESFLKHFTGTVLFEVFFVKGYNTGKQDLRALKDTLVRFKLDRIQLNTAVRPGTERDIEPLDPASLERIASFISPRCEVITRIPLKSIEREDKAVEAKILSLIERRPCTVRDIHTSLGIPIAGVLKIVDILSEKGKIISETHGSKTFYIAANRGKTAG